MDDRLFDLVCELGAPERRERTAARIAEIVAVEALLLFVRDASIDVLVPAPGFPQTLPGGPTWRRFLAECRSRPTVTGQLAFPDAGHLRPAVAISDPAGITAVLVGGLPDEAALTEVRRTLPLMAALLRAEQAAAVAAGEIAVAREQAQHAQSLSLALEAARAEIERALAEAGRLNRELKQADALKDEFLATLAHELRNPLAALVSAIYLTRTRMAAEHPAAPSVTVAVRQADRLAKLVDDLMDVARITHGKIELQTEPLDVEEILARAAESVRPHVEAREHLLTINYAGGPLWIAADALRLEQIVVNLLANAVKYTSPGGRLALSAARIAVEGEHRVCVTVRDNGIGISAGFLPRVFDLFMQADRSQERSLGGLGIGLTLVRKLVEMQGGTISLTSEGLGKGTEVAVCFPAIAARVRRETPVSGQASGGLACAPRRVLIVDDNDDAASMAAELIALWGHEPRVVNDGATAIAESEIFKPHVVLLDIGLPDISGYEVALRIKQRQQGNPPVLVALTGYGQPADRRRSAEAGFDHHFTKPVDMDEIEKLLAANASGVTG